MRISRLMFAAALAAAALPAFADHTHDAAATPPGSASDCWLPAFKAGDADAVAACYLPDALMFFPGGPAASGRQAIRDGYAHFFTEVTIKDATTAEIGRVAHGDTLTSWGTYTVTFVPKSGGPEVVQHGRFTDVAKFVDGQWRYVVDHPSDDPPPPATK
jgi:uncharacterized protein (TIGR02246 family)